MSPPHQVLATLWQHTTGEPLDHDGVELDADRQVLPGSFLVGVAAACSVAATTLAAGRLLRDRGGDPGQVRVTAREAAAAFRSERYLRVDDAEPDDPWAPLSGDYQAADGWVRLHCNYPHHRDAVLAALHVPDDRDAVAAAVAALPADQVERAVRAAGGCAARMRTPDAWSRHPQAAALRELPLVDVRPLGPGPVRPLPPADRPLSGVRVLDLTHVIAGPVCGRTLAAHGADVLHVGAAHLPTVPPLVVDTGFGKRSCHLDLRTDAGRAGLRELVADADVVVQSYRPGALAALGFGPTDLALLRPGIVAVDLSAYGWAGPWAQRRGFDSLVQMASGIAHGPVRPRPLPAQALDHGTGWLAAFGVLDALWRRARYGGSWLVRVSLARTALWLDGLGRATAEGSELGRHDLADLLTTTDSPFGRLSHLRPPGDLPGAPPHWTHGPHLPGSDAPAWW